MSPQPNLFLVGSMKSGTSSLHSYLGSHPSIFMVPMKEPTHFVDGAELKPVSPGLWEAGIWRDRAQYLDMFADAGNANVVGESSTNYSKLPQITGVAQRIAEFNPSARILYIMRDPIERSISHYWHMVKWHNESREILRAMQQDPSYRQVSHYSLQLAPYFECFAREQIKTLTLENLKADPVGTMRELFEWLGVAPTGGTTKLGPAKNVTTREVSQARGGGILQRIKHSRAWDTVGPLVPKSIREIGNRLSERRVDRQQIDTRKVVEYLRPLQQAETIELVGLLGREFHEWQTLRPTVAGTPEDAD